MISILESQPLTSMKFIYLFIIGLTLSACTYQIEIQQGNSITQPQLDKLTVGMSMNEVQNLLGTPLLKDPFHSNRWDYLYSIRSQERPREPHRLAIFFSGERVESFTSEGTFPESIYKETLTDHK